MVRIGICDDKVVHVKLIKEIVEKNLSLYTSEYNIICCTSGIQLLNTHGNEPFDAIFLDIDMPKVTGFDVAEMLRADFSNCFIIFITTHAELVYESMGFQPFDFIRKNCSIPVEDGIKKVLKRLMKHMKQNDTVVLEDDLSGKCAVYIRDIIYIESDRHYVKYYIAAKEYPIKMRKSITECEDKFGEYNFIRIHKSFIVNLRYVSYLDTVKEEVLLGVNNQKLPLSRKYKKIADEKYTIYTRIKS